MFVYGDPPRVSELRGCCPRGQGEDMPRALSIAELEKKYENHDDNIQLIFEAIKKLLESVPVPQKPPIGFNRE